MADVFTRELVDSLGGSVAEKLAAQNLVTKDQALAALSSLSPVLLGGLKRKQAEVGESGLEALMVDAGASEDHFDEHGALQSDLTGLGGNLGGILDSDAQEQTAHALSQKLGIGKSVAKQLIPILAPIILSMLMKKGKSGGASSSAGGIGSILDRDGDGSIIDDIAGMVLGGGQSNKKGGFFQMLLSFFLRR